MIYYWIRFTLYALGIHLALWILFDSATQALNQGWLVVGFGLQALGVGIFMAFWTLWIKKWYRAYRAWVLFLPLEPVSFAFCLRKNLSPEQVSKAHTLWLKSSQTTSLTVKDFLFEDNYS